MNIFPSNDREKWCYAGDEGRPLKAGLQEQALNHLKLQGLRAGVVSVEEKAGRNLSGRRQGDEREANRRSRVESVGTTSKPGGVVNPG
jgi:hypothetical protein